jgi:hypothetical protein
MHQMVGLAFTPEQFQTLLRMIYIANTVANGHRDEGFLKAYDELEQYVFSRAKEAGLPAATERHTVEGEEHHHPSLRFEHDPEVNKLLDEYENVVLIELLAERLAERDLEKKYGPNAKDRMPEKNYQDLLSDRADEYEREFEASDLKGVRVEGMDAI